MSTNSTVHVYIKVIFHNRLRDENTKLTKCLICGPLNCTNTETWISTEIFPSVYDGGPDTTSETKVHACFTIVCQRKRCGIIVPRYGAIN